MEELEKLIQELRNIEPPKPAPGGKPIVPLRSREPKDFIEYAGKLEEYLKTYNCFSDQFNKDYEAYRKRYDDKLLSIKEWLLTSILGDFKHPKSEILWDIASENFSLNDDYRELYENIQKLSKLVL